MATATAVLKIGNSVGRRGVNRRDDVLLIQQLINAKLPSGIRSLKVDGACGPLTITAIEAIQKQKLCVDSPDGKVDPGGATFHFLTGQTTASSTPKPGGAVPKIHHAAHLSGVAAAIPDDVITAAKASQKSWKIPASVSIAQWALESNWGKAMPTGSNNPFGIKAVGSQPSVEAHTREVIHGKDVTIVAKFRKFTSLTDAFDQHGKLLATASPYKHARTLEYSPDSFADALTGVYATDPNYGTLLKKIMKSHNLYQYN